MKKIHTLFERKFVNHKIVGITEKVMPGMEWVLEGEGTATVKIDGSCCAIINGELYKRYDAKKGKKPPVGAIPCCDPDPVTGHHPHWVKCESDKPEDKWYISAFNRYAKMCENCKMNIKYGTYEAIGPHFQGNPYELEEDILSEHGNKTIQVERTLDGIKHFLESHEIEGLVFWKDGEPQCKIKRTDFGLKWPV